MPATPPSSQNYEWITVEGEVLVLIIWGIWIKNLHMSRRRNCSCRRLDYDDVGICRLDEGIGTFCHVPWFHRPCWRFCVDVFTSWSGRSINKNSHNSACDSQPTEEWLEGAAWTSKIVWFSTMSNSGGDLGSLWCPWYPTMTKWDTVTEQIDPDPNHRSSDWSHGQLHTMFTVYQRPYIYVVLFGISS